MKAIRILKTLLVIGLFVSSLWAQNGFAHDSDLYLSSGQGVEPNILIIFDSSGSMGDLVPAPPYTNATDYASLLTTPEVPSANRNVVYSCTTSGSCTTVYKTDISLVLCNAAQTALTNYGYYQGRLKSDSRCGTRSAGDPSYTLRTGNYRNYLKWKTSDPTYSKTKIEVAKDVVKTFVDTIEGVRVGVMRFNSSEGGRIQSFVVSLDPASKATLKTDVDAINASGYTPLAETLYEAGIYFKGGASYFNAPQTYTSPIQYSCQRNYAIIVTDGDSTQDRNAILRTIGNQGDMDGDGYEPGGAHEKRYYDCSSCNPSCAYPDCPNNNSCCNDLNGSDYLDDVAKYLYDTDLRSDLTGKQNINTYTIGFTVNSQWGLLERTATHGHGKYYFCNDSQELSESFQNIIADILAKSSSFVAPIVPVSQLERSTAGDKMYMAFFKPSRDGMWKGNIKKFGIAQPMGVSSDCPYNPSLAVGEVIDSNCRSALDNHGQFYQAAKSYWATINNDNDGGEVENGGVGEVLMDRDFNSNPRNIYTYLMSNVSLTHTSNAFQKTNITPSALGLGLDSDPAAQTARDQLVDYVYGYDAYGSITNQKRDWILGSFLHSRPFIIPYGSHSSTVIYAGGNDGMLHAFDASNGRELWAFIPPNLLNKLQALHLDVNEVFVDGSPKAYIENDSDGNVTKAILIFGQRRGGDRYIALDVSSPTAPKFLWEIGPSAIILGNVKTDTLDYKELGQTWSTPRIGFIDDGSGNKKAVMFIGGGYDTGQDNDTPPADTKGRAIYIVDVFTGSLVARFSNQEYPGTMIYSIPSDLTAVDLDGDGKIDRVYVGDIGGQMWRFNITPNVASSTGKILFKSNPGRDASVGRKIFYAPDVSLEKEVRTVSGIPRHMDYEMVYFATGDREHPNNVSVVNRLYAIKDRDPDTPLTEGTDMIVDVTEDLLQEPTTTVADLRLIRDQLKELNGWFIKLNQFSGEKSLSSSVVFYGVVYYTTFTPNTAGGDPSTDPCYVGEGKGRLYTVDWFTGNAVFDNDPGNNITARDPELGQDRMYSLRRNDRIGDGGTGIPSNPIITFIQGQSVGYVGISDGIKPITLKTGKSLIPIYWYLKGGQ